MTDLSSLTNPLAGRTRDFEFVRGEYAISGERVPYFATTMSVTEALTHLSLAQSLALDPEEPVNLDELMQRDLSEGRAHNEIAEYLKQPGQLKFFNSLTVVLMPVANGRPQVAFPVSALQPRTENGMLVTDVGPVTIKRLGTTAFGHLSWATDSVSAVIIDGQHRFAAIRRVREEMPALMQADVTSLPILLLVLDERAGFSPSVGGQQGIVKASRAIFTDINKYAVKVSSDREYLLDDLSLNAVSMRRLITSGIGGTTRTELEASPSRVPLAVVDWSSGQSKFEDGLYITTLQALHQLVGEVLGPVRPPSLAYPELREWLDRLESRIDLASETAWPQEAIRDRLRRSEEEELPFNLLTSEVDIAARRFAVTGPGQVVTRTLTELAPYRALLERYLDSGLLGTEKELWLGQTGNARAAAKIQFNIDPEGEARTIATEVKAAYRLAYQVVFQRAFVLAASEIFGVADELKAGWGLAEDTGNLGVLSSWIPNFNDAMAPRLNDDVFWSGTAITPDGRIDYGQRGKKAVWGLVVLGTVPATAHEVERWQSERSDRHRLTTNRYTGVVQNLLSDRLLLSEPSPNQVRRVSEWRSLLDGRSRTSDGDVARLRRQAALAYRAGLRRYVELSAAANALEITNEQRDDLVLTLGARRLASLVE